MTRITYFFINKKKNGEEFWESASISPLQDDEGQITHFVAVKQDITEPAIYAAILAVLLGFRLYTRHKKTG